MAESVNTCFHILKVVVTQSVWLFVWLFDPKDCIAHQAPLSMEFSRQEYWSG